MSNLKGYPVQGRREDLDSLDLNLVNLHPTFTQTGVNKYSLDTFPYGVFLVASNLEVEAGSSLSTVKLSGHSVKKGDIIAIKTSSNDIDENFMGVLRVDDEDTFTLAGALSAQLSAGDTIDLLRPIYQRVTETGASIASVEAAPISIFRGTAGSYSEVNIRKDTADPGNTIPMPVEIVSASGTEINITAGDINVQNTHEGVNFSSIRIGDGTTLANVTLENELRVSDEQVLGELETLNTVDFATQTTLESVDSKFNSLGQKNMAGSTPVVIASDQSAIDVSNISGDISLPTGASTEAKQDDIISELQNLVSEDFATETTLSSLNGKFNSLGAKSSAASVPVVLSTEQNTLLTEIRNASEALSGAVNVSDQIDINIADAGDVATETTLSAINNKLPASLGAKTSDNSLSVTLASDEAPVQIDREGVVAFDRVVFSSTSVGDSYVAFDASSGAYSGVRFFYAGGVPLYLATGGIGSEVNRMIIPPGADFEIGIDIENASRLSLRTVDGSTVETGQLIMNWTV